VQLEVAESDASVRYYATTLDWYDGRYRPSPSASAMVCVIMSFASQTLGNWRSHRDGLAVVLTELVAVTIRDCDYPLARGGSDYLQGPGGHYRGQP
jgi:hypothetical protein